TSGLPGAATGISVTCSSLPPASTCNVTQTPDSQGVFTSLSIGIVTTGNKASTTPVLPRLLWPVAGLALATVCTARRGRRLRIALLSLFLVSWVGFLVSCGTSTSSSSTGGTVTPPGNYTVTISAMRGNLTHTFTLTLTVQ